MKRIASAIIGYTLALALGISMTACGAGGTFDTSSEITVISREEGSGTRGAFVELFGIEKKDDQGNKVDYTADSAEINDSTGIVLTNVADNINAVGYVSLGALNDTVKAVKIDGAEASVENVKNGTYKIARPFNIAYMGELSAAAKDFVDFILSTEGQTVVSDNGYISNDNTAAYAGTKPSGNITVAGSSSVTPLMEKLKEAYIAVNTGAQIEIQQSDSTTGMNSAVEGICDIGMASRELKDSETEAGLTSTVIATDGIAVVVNPDNTIEDLTVEQVMKIYTGEFTTWSEVIE